MSGLAILCSGQGRQDWASLEALLKYPEAEAIFEHLYNFRLMPEALEKYFQEPSTNPQLIFDNESAQPFIVIYHILLWELLRNIIPKPELFAGYSLGELSIYNFAEVIKAEDLLRMATQRGRLMSQAAREPQTMIAVTGIKHDKMEKICRDCNAHIAIINAAEHFVIGLSVDKVNTFIEECRNAGAARTVRLPVSIASHTPYMEKAALEFNKELQDIPFNASTSGIIGGISGEKLFSGKDMIKALTAQISHTIDWRACMETAISYGCRVFLETGPGNSLSSMFMETFPDVEARSVSDFHDIHAIEAWIKSAFERQY